MDIVYKEPIKKGPTAPYSAKPFISWCPGRDLNSYEA